MTTLIGSKGFVMGNTAIVSGYIRQAGNVCFVIGAGASKSAGIPLASELVAQVLQDYSHCLNNLSDNEKADYGKVMSQLSPQEREALITPLLENSGISWGQIALACLITSGKISRVLTFNFDLVLERSISLLGGQFPIYDFGTSPTSEIGRIASPAIIHLHGQSHGLVLLNTDEETQKHKDALRPLISDTIRNNITIVIGYSGEADAAFDLFESEYNSHNRLVWLGYSEEPGKHLKPLLDQGYAEYIGNCDFDQTMMSIAKDLGVWPPAIFSNPMNHLLDELSLVKKFPLNGQADELDVLKHTTTRLQGFSKQWDAEKQPDDEAFSSLIDGKRESLSADWVLENQDVLSEEAKNAISWDILKQAGAMLDEAERLSGKEAANRFSESYAKYAAALEVKPDSHAALNNWGNALLAEAKTLSGKAARDRLSEATAKYEAALEIKPNKHKAHYNLGSVFAMEANTLSGNAKLQKLQLAEGKLSHAKKIEGKASYNLACVFSMTGRIDEAVAELYQCQKDGTLETFSFMSEDTDLDLLRKNKKFQKLMDDIKP